jgi:purine-nucleoside phosphorylase
MHRRNVAVIAMMMQASLDYILSRTKLSPRVAVVLGSGLGAFADELTDSIDLPYSEIPGWPKCTCIGHAGKLVFGKLDELEVAVMAGRSHLYEGYSPAQVTMGVRVLHQLGVRSIVLTNAAGGINLAYSQGALVLISDHINLQGLNPLVGLNDDSFGPRFPDMTEAYSASYRAIAQEVAGELEIELSEGVYAAVTGPSYETPAEIRYLRTIGADWWACRPFQKRLWRITWECVCLRFRVSLIWRLVCCRRRLCIWRCWRRGGGCRIRWCGF